MKDIVKDYLSIEGEFFELDEEAHLAHVCLQYESPRDIIDGSIVTATPRFSRDFLDRIIDVFDMIPDAYKLDIKVCFDDLDGYSEEELSTINQKNIFLEMRILSENVRRRNRLILSLCALGAFFVFLAFLANACWKTDSPLRDIVLFVLDIASTVPFWGAADIYLVAGKEKRRQVSNLLHRFHSMSFHQKEKQ